MRTLRSLVGRTLDADPEVRRAAVEELTKLKTPAARDALVACLDHRDPEVRRHAAGGLGRFGEAVLGPLLIKAARLEGDPRAHTALWKAAARVYRDDGRLDDLRRIIALLDDPRVCDDSLSDLCGAVLSILAGNPAELPVTLIGVLTDPSVSGSALIQTALQKAMTSLVGQRYARPLAPTYLELLQEEAYRTYHAAFVEALGHMRERRAIGTLLEKFEQIGRAHV